MAVFRVVLNNPLFLLKSAAAMEILKSAISCRFLEGRFRPPKPKKTHFFRVFRKSQNRGVFRKHAPGGGFRQNPKKRQKNTFYA
jgi:hypothetical protein